MRLGGVGFTSSSHLYCDVSVSGLGGLDTGSIGIGLYYVYVVYSANQFYLICSLSSSGPLGYSNYRYVGAFLTNPSSQVDKVFIESADVSFGVSSNQMILTANYTITTLVDNYVFDSVAKEITLPDALENTGRVITIGLKASGGDIVINAESGDYIGRPGTGFTKYHIYQNGAMVSFRSMGDRWIVHSRNELDIVSNYYSTHRQSGGNGSTNTGVLGSVTIYEGEYDTEFGGQMSNWCDSACTYFDGYVYLSVNGSTYGATLTLDPATARGADRTYAQYYKRHISTVPAGSSYTYTFNTYINQVGGAYNAKDFNINVKHTRK